MTAEQLIQQYPGAITARELVKGVWETSEYDTECSRGGSWRYKEPHPLHVLGWFGWDKSSPDALVKLHAAAAAFTVSRIEEIRQVKEEIALLRGLVILLNEEPGDLSTPAWLRVITREQSALAELSRGIRPEAL